VNEYSGKLPVFHMDLYRLNTTDELFELGILDYLRKVETGIMIVEWAEKIIDILPEDYLKIEFQVLSLTSRRLEFESIGGRFIKNFEVSENLGDRFIKNLKHRRADENSRH
ncbi:MAG: tRNA (adenosine(37)-N6)-threonylcarbamoyltransferase complex ATPase subunit type 1 TsaE, partial [Dehalococcoidales bacterium]